MMIKSEIRKEITERFRTTNSLHLMEWSEQICNHFIKSDFIEKCTVFLLYTPLKNEVDITRIIETLLQNRKIVLLPRWIGNTMVPVRIFSREDMINMNSLEAYLGRVDITITPGRAFDQNKNRLGRWKWCYDRFFSSVSTYKIGLAFDFQIFETIPTEEHDYRMDSILSENGIF